MKAEVKTSYKEAEHWNKKKIEDNDMIRKRTSTIRARTRARTITSKTRTARTINTGRARSTNYKRKNATMQEQKLTSKANLGHDMFPTKVFFVSRCKG